jgi:AAA domain-containing protein
LSSALSVPLGFSIRAAFASRRDWIGEEPPPPNGSLAEPDGAAAEEPLAPPAPTVIKNGRPYLGPGERLRLTRISDVEAKRITWLEESLIARGLLTGLIAAGGTVKGLYGVHLAAKLAKRGETTLFLCSEDALNYIVRPRFEAAGCDGQLAQALEIETETGPRNLRFPADLPALSAALAEVRPALVIIDPIASYLDAGLDMAKNNQMREVLQPLIALALETLVAIVVIYHLGKDRSRGALGSVAFEDACRFVLTAAKDDEDEDVRHVEVTKSNVGPTGFGRKLRIVGVPLELEGETVEVAKLVDEGRSDKSVPALLTRRTTPGPEPEKRDLARQVLIETLVAAAGEGVNANTTKETVAGLTDVSLQTVWRAFTELRDEGLAGAASTRDEHGSITEWRWFAKSGLLLGCDGG